MASTRPCDFPGCNKPRHVAELCQAHSKQKRAGKTLTPLRSFHASTELAIKRFWARVNIPNQGLCWGWTGGVSGSGYGYLPSPFTRRYTGAHRLAWTLTNGDIPAGLIVCHTCDNKLCCNPSHMWLGTDAENAEDKVRKGRARTGNTGKTHCIHGHEFNEANTYIAPGSGKRSCRRCSTEKQRVYRARKLQIGRD